MYDRFTSTCTSITCKLWDVVWVMSKTIVSMSILFSLINFTTTIIPLFRSEMTLIQIKLVWNDLFLFVLLVLFTPSLDVPDYRGQI